jgi:hypothetical protein
MARKKVAKGISGSKQSTDLADILFPTGEDQDHLDSILSIPPEQRRLHTETVDYNVSTLVDALKNNSIRVPEFQRRYVWNNSQASRLIESLIIQCPIPVVYLSQRPDEILDVVDGNQRLRTLRRFLGDEFTLTGLTAYPEIEGNSFSTLDPRFQRHIVNRTIRCLIILKDTHPQVKFDVFERLNSGAVKLNAQELRNGIYHGEATKLAEKLAEDKVFSTLVSVSANKRMKLEELVIRFFALIDDLDGYSKPLSGFLNNYCDSHRDLNTSKKQDLVTRFDATVQCVSKVFGDLAFSIFDNETNIISKFNAALYDCQMVGLARLTRNPDWNIPSRKLAISKMQRLFQDQVFVKQISKATSDESSVKGRIAKFESVFAND